MGRFRLMVSGVWGTTMGRFRLMVSGSRRRIKSSITGSEEALLHAVGGALIGGGTVLPPDLRQDGKDLSPVTLLDSTGIVGEALHPDFHH